MSLRCLNGSQYPVLSTKNWVPGTWVSYANGAGLFVITPGMGWRLFKLDNRPEWSGRTGKALTEHHQPDDQHDFGVHTLGGKCLLT